MDSSSTFLGYIQETDIHMNGCRYTHVDTQHVVHDCVFKGCMYVQPCLFNWIIQGLGMSSRVCVTGHITDPVPFLEKNRASCTGRRFPPSFIHQVNIITGLNKLYDDMFSP